MNEYQLLRINERLGLNYTQELEKTSEGKKEFSKKFRDQLDILIHQFYRDGIQFYGFTINMLSLNLKEDMWFKVHKYVESCIENLGLGIELIEFSYLSIELHNDKKGSSKKKIVMKSTQELKNKRKLKGTPHIHGIIGVRTILGENDYLQIQIKNELYRMFSLDDIKIDKLNKIKDIKNYWNYVIKEENYKFHRFCQYSLHPNYLDIYGSIADLELIFDDDYRQAFGFDMFNYSPTRMIRGVKSKDPESKTLINYLLSLYMDSKEYKIYKSKIYTKMPESLKSWKFLYDLQELKTNSIQIIQELKILYPQQLKELNTMDIIFKDWNKTIDDIQENNKYLPDLEPQEDAVEFKDGIYFINEHKFLTWKNKAFEIEQKLQGKQVLVYFNKSYHNLKIPVVWLQSIKKTIVEVEDFCIDFARYFHSKPLEKIKQKSLVIVGSSNTGKTTLITDVLVNLFGKENIGIIGKGDNFILEQLENKKVIVADEFSYNQVNRSNILKLMGNELDLINKKGKQKYLFMNTAPVIFLFNSYLNDRMMNDDAFKNRLIHHQFQHEITEYINNIDEILKNELPQILIYCNKLFFKRKKSIRNSKEKRGFFLLKNQKYVIKKEEEFPI